LPDPQLHLIQGALVLLCWKLLHPVSIDEFNLVYGAMSLWVSCELDFVQAVQKSKAMLWQDTL
jgi:hypothetical protein